MSVPTIAPYFPFRRIKIVDQIVSETRARPGFRCQPDKRFQPICHCCGQTATGVHSWTERKVRDLNLAATPVWLNCHYRKVFCSHCQRVSVEDLELFHPYLRVTTRLAHYIYQLCRIMTVTDVARAIGAGLENGQRHRRILPGTRLWSARLHRVKHPGRRRDLHSQGPPLPDRRPRLCHRPSGVCRKGPQGRNPGALFRSTQPLQRNDHQGRGNGHLGSVHQGR